MSQFQHYPKAPLGQKFNVAPPAPTAEASSSTTPRPGTATSTPPPLVSQIPVQHQAQPQTQTQDAITPAAPAPSALPTNAPIPPQTAHTTPAEEDPQNYNDKLNAADRYWKFKFGFKAILIITGLIGIGTTGWTLSTQVSNGGVTGYGYGYDAFWTLWPSLVTFSASIVWCGACIAVFLLRKKAVHPGARVAVDLLLWLGFIVTALFAVVALLDTMNWGSYGGFSFGYYSSSDGDYELQSNNTWIWVVDNSTSSYISSPRDCTGSSRSYYYYDFASCAEQDAYINKLWSEKPQRVAVQMAGVVCQFFGLFCHLVLFVWACVDTHRYNRARVSKDAEKLAAGIVQTMIHNGAVVPPPGQAYMRPQMGQGMYYQLPAQAYPMTTMYSQQGQQGQMQMPIGQYGQQGMQMQQGQYPMASFSQPGGAPSDEKSNGPRYA